MKPYKITIKDSAGTRTYSGMFRNSIEAVRDALGRLTEISKVTVQPCAA